MAEKRDTVARVIDMEDLRKTFKYEDGKLFRFWRGMYWREVDISKPNDHGYAVVNYNGRPAFAHRIERVGVVVEFWEDGAKLH